MASKPDQVLLRYQIIKQLSNGWAGKVYLVEDRENGNVQRALKMQPLIKSPWTIGNNPRMESKCGEYLNRLIREGKTVAFVETIESFQHWNFIEPNWFDRIFRPRTYWYIVSELVDGTNLKQALTNEATPDTPANNPSPALTVDFLRSVVFQILFALIAAQRELHFTHYDLWCKNVMLTKQVKAAPVEENQNVERRDLAGEVREREQDELWTFQLGDFTYYVPSSHTNKQICKIFDYGLARVEVRHRGRMVDVVEDRNILHHHFNVHYDMKNLCFSMLEKIPPERLEELFRESQQLHDVLGRMLGLETSNDVVKVISRFSYYDIFHPHRRVLEVAKSLHSSRWYAMWAKCTWALNIHDTRMSIADILGMPFFQRNVRTILLGTRIGTDMWSTTYFPVVTVHSGIAGTPPSEIQSKKERGSCA